MKISVETLRKILLSEVAADIEIDISIYETDCYRCPLLDRERDYCPVMNESIYDYTGEVTPFCQVETEL